MIRVNKRLNHVLRLTLKIDDYLFRLHLKYG